LKSDDEFDKPEHTKWPQFHAGVPDGLSVFTTDHSWLLDSLTPDLTPYSSGLLLGFGMTGLLTKFSKVDLYLYLTTPNVKDANGVALILGLGIAYRSKRDLGLSQMFTLDIPRSGLYQ
jgi:hypothetical protein